MSACAKCGMKLMSATTVNGLFVCDWCKPKPEAPTDFTRKPEPPPAQAPGAREWYLNPVVGYKCEVNENGIGLSGNEVHVIEHSAYAKLLAENARLRALLSETKQEK